MFIGFLLITTCLFQVSDTEGELDRSCMPTIASGGRILAWGVEFRLNFL